MTADALEVAYMHHWLAIEIGDLVSIAHCERICRTIEELVEREMEQVMHGNALEVINVDEHEDEEEVN
jgi:hypothetical protein